MKILIIEGSLSPPVFIRSLMEGLLAHGVAVGLLGNYTPNGFNSSSPLFTRLITRYSKFNTLRLLLSCFVLCLVHNKAWRVAAGYVQNVDGMRLRLKHWRTHALILVYEPDVIHFQWAAHIEFYEPLIRAKHIKTVLSLRGRHINVTPHVVPSLKQLYADLFPQISGFHAVSKAMATAAIQHGAPAGRIRVIHSFVPSDFIKAYRNEPFGGINGSLKIVSVGRFHWQKGYTDAVLAMRKLKDKNIKFSYTIVSSGKIPTEILYLLKQLDLAAEVEIIPGVPHAEMPTLMTKFSILLLPSLEEGIANVVLEAMAVGLPVLSTRCGGMAEVIEHGVNGWLVPVRNPEAIATELEYFSQQSIETITLTREKAHQTIVNNYVQEKSIPRFVDLYSSLNKGSWGV